MNIDMRTETDAMETLLHIPGINVEYMMKMLRDELLMRTTTNDYEFYSFLDSNGIILPRLKDINVVFSHITTSANECANYRTYGILSLVDTYRCEDSELRQFLTSENIEINIDFLCLKHNDKYYSIDYEDIEHSGSSEESNELRIGWRFSKDAGICGFLHINEKDTYLGNVHKRPEVLSDIDNLLNLNLSKKWEETHQPYEIIASVSGNQIDTFGDADEDWIKRRLYQTFCVATSAELTVDDFQCKKGEIIRPEQIININDFNLWR